MRDYIKEVWQKYREKIVGGPSSGAEVGYANILTRRQAILTTNATFDITRTYEDDFPAVSALLSNYSKTTHPHPYVHTARNRMRALPSA